MWKVLYDLFCISKKSPVTMWGMDWSGWEGQRQGDMLKGYQRTLQPWLQSLQPQKVHSPQE